MRILADENVPKKVVQILRQQGHDVVWMAETAPGSKDEEVMARAREEGRVLLTFDKDFGEEAFKRGEELSGIILVRIRLRSPESVASVVARALEQPISWQDCFSVITEDRIRSIPLPKREEKQSS